MVKGTTLLRNAIPAVIVAMVLGSSFVISAGAKDNNPGSDVGYGYANNCGVKGDGFHDHGKVCPNRPFPGNGITESSGVTESGDNTATHSNVGKGRGHGYF